MAFARIRDCTCPGTPHAEGDGVFLRDTITLRGGLAAERVIVGVINDLALRGETEESAIDDALTPGLLDVYLRDGCTGWNVEDEDGPVPFVLEDLLADYNLALPVAQKAQELYTEAVMRPLTARLSVTSARGSTSVSTSRTRKPTPRRRKPSSRATSAASRRLTA